MSDCGNTYFHDWLVGYLPWGRTRLSLCMGSRCWPGRPSAGGEKYPELAAPDIPQRDAIALVAFYDDMIRSWREPDDRVFVVIRDYCLALGIDPNGHLERLHHDPFYRPHLRRRVIPLAIASISTGHVSEAVRDKLLRYKEECAKVLRDYWFRREVVETFIAPAFRS